MQFRVWFNPTTHSPTHIASWPPVGRYVSAAAPPPHSLCQLSRFPFPVTPSGLLESTCNYRPDNTGPGARVSSSLNRDRCLVSGHPRRKAPPLHYYTVAHCSGAGGCTRCFLPGHYRVANRRRCIISGFTAIGTNVMAAPYPPQHVRDDAFTDLMHCIGLRIISRLLSQFYLLTYTIEKV